MDKVKRIWNFFTLSLSSSFVVISLLLIIFFFEIFFEFFIPYISLQQHNWNMYHNYQPAYHRKGSLCVSYWYSGRVLWAIYYVVEFQLSSGITTAIYSVAYCYVTLPCLHWYSSLHFIHHIRLFDHLVISRLHTIISTYCTRSSACLGVAQFRSRILTSCSASLLFSQLLLYGSFTLSPHPCFSLYLCQNPPKLLLRCLLDPPLIPTESSPLISLLSYIHFK